MLTEKMAVVQHNAGGKDVTLRIVAVHPTARCIAVIPALTKEKVWPHWENLDDWERALKKHTIEPCEKDPHAQLFDPKYDSLDPKLKAQFAKYAEQRDFRWMVIEPLVATLDIFDRRKRGPLIAARVEEIRALHLPGDKRASKNSINKWLRLYWQGGLRKNALIPRWEWNRRGGKSQTQYPGLRLNSFKDKQGRLWHGVQAVMAWGLETFRPAGLSLSKIRTRINTKHFSNGQVLKDGRPIPVLKKHNLTEWMLRYFYRTHWDKAQELREQVGNDEYESNHRAQKGTASRRVSAPGDCFQLDASKTNITVVSSLNRAFELGKVTFCIAVDQFTGMFCGFSIDYRDESYLSYMLAIEHAATNKVEWCKRYGRTIKAEEWPCEHLAKTYVTDRGPLRKWLGNKLVNTLGIDLENAPAYRPDLRGLVESAIKRIKRDALRYCDGVVDRPRAPGRRRRKREASLTIDELIQIVMNEMIAHNQRVLKNRRLTKEMIQDGVPRVPTKLWPWGVRTLGGSLRKEDQNTLRLNLLPYEYGSITKEGLVFKTRLYACDPALVERARREGNIKTLVHSDPRRPDEVYRRTNLNTVEIEVCPLSKGDDAWKGTSEEDHAVVMQRFKEIEADAEHRYQQARAEADARNDALQRKARHQHRQDQHALGVPKNETRDNPTRRKAAQAMRDEEEAWRLDTNGPSNQIMPPAPAADSSEDDLDWAAIAALDNDRPTSLSA